MEGLGLLYQHWGFLKPRRRKGFLIPRLPVNHQNKSFSLFLLDGAEKVAARDGT